MAVATVGPAGAQNPPPQTAADAARDAQRTKLAAGLHAGGVVLALRHAQAPGTFDPPGFDLARCETQRNLGDEGRAQATRIGQWLRSQGLAPVAVRSSPWCRCRDTAQIAFGRAEVWSALGSPARSDATARAAQQATLRRALLAASTRRGEFEAWVTHQFVLRDLTGESTGDGEALLLRMRSAPTTTAGALPEAEVLARAWLH
ncbi:MAG: histidine phosphatase family protein [Rubrivivax sp.]|nr:histidine phosphatase family protein [Rubrivivax sp.]